MSTEIGGVSESLISGAHTSVINYLVRVIILYALRAKYPYLDYKRVRLTGQDMKIRFRIKIIET